MVEVGIDRDALPGVQPDLGPRRDEKGLAVLEDLDAGASKASSGVEQQTRIRMEPPPRLIMSSILFQWKCMGEYWPSSSISSFSA